ANRLGAAQACKGAARRTHQRPQAPGGAAAPRDSAEDGLGEVRRSERIVEQAAGFPVSTRGEAARRAGGALVAHPCDGRQRPALRRSGCWGPPAAAWQTSKRRAAQE